MVKVHRNLLERLGDPPIAILDTPVGFQLNARTVAGKAVEYFRISLHKDAQVASYRTVNDSAITLENALKQIRDAGYVFAGPGSPTYALKLWTQTQIPELLREKLQRGGGVTFASAAALTLGRYTIPVYEVYKVGEPPRWEKGLDLVAEAGLAVALVPHYNNREGGDHDTRFCYLGEERLVALEEQLPDDTFLLGVDEHTALILDLDADSADVIGVGGVTVRLGGAERRIENGASVPIAHLRAISGGEGLAPAARFAPTDDAHPEDAGSPFWEGVERSRQTFVQALADHDLEPALNALLELDDHLWAWSTESFVTDEQQRARAALREMVVRVGDTAARAPRDLREIIAPYVEALLELRERARSQGRFDEADAVRDALTGQGIEIHDEPNVTSWFPRSEP
ncbi:MAG: CysS/YqeB C-terminal domain-containing protein [Actinomycetota bacterium]